MGHVVRSNRAKLVNMEPQLKNKYSFMLYYGNFERFSGNLSTASRNCSVNAEINEQENTEAVSAKLDCAGAQKPNERTK